MAPTGSPYDPMRPACDGVTQYFAWPSRRVAQLVRRFEETYRNGVLGSTCHNVDRLDEPPHTNPATGTLEFSLRDPDGYYVAISALPLCFTPAAGCATLRRRQEGDPRGRVSARAQT